MKVFIIIWEKATRKYWRNDDGEYLTYDDIDHAKSEMRKEGFTEDFMVNGVEYHDHLIIDKSGYDYQ